MSADGAEGLPTAADVRGLLNGLFDRAVTVEAEKAPVLRGRDVHVVGSYVDDTGAVRAVLTTGAFALFCRALNFAAACAFVAVCRASSRTWARWSKCSYTGACTRISAPS